MKKMAKNVKRLTSILRLEEKRRSWKSMKKWKKMKIKSSFKETNTVLQASIEVKIVSYCQKVSKSPKKFQKNPAKRLTYFQYVVQLKT